MSTRPPTAYALTFHKISTILTPRTKKTFPRLQPGPRYSIVKEGNAPFGWLDYTHGLRADQASGPGRLSEMTRKRSNQPRFSSLCPASLIRAEWGIGRSAAQGFDAKSGTRFFFAEGSADRRVALPRRAARGQAVEMFVELTCAEARAGARPLLPQGNR
jgi:hypothetical protein